MRMGLRIASNLTAILASVGLLAFSGYHAAAAERIIHFINVHGHYVPSGPSFPPKSKMAVKFGFSGMPVSELFASMDRWGVDVFVIPKGEATPARSRLLASRSELQLHLGGFCA